MRTPAAIGALLCVLVTGCFGTGGGSKFSRLPSDDRDLFFRCWPSMKKPACGEDRDAVYVTICVRAEQNKYAERPAAKRGRWLVAHGCPKDMVEAAQGDSDDEEDSQ